MHPFRKARSLTFSALPLLDISVKATTSGWPVLPTCLLRASWSEERGWSLWEFCLLPTLCFTATCTSWRTKSGESAGSVCSYFCCWNLIFCFGLYFLHQPVCILYLFLTQLSSQFFFSLCANLHPCFLFQMFSSIKHEPWFSVSCSFCHKNSLMCCFSMESEHKAGRNLDSIFSLLLYNTAPLIQPL